MAELNNIDYAENLFQAIDTIVAARIKQQSKDITVLATIVDDTSRMRGSYKVTEDNNFIYSAISEYPYYSKDEQVYVLKTALGVNIILSSRVFNKKLFASPDTLTYIGNLKHSLTNEHLSEMTNELTYVKQKVENLNVDELTVLRDRLMDIDVDELTALRDELNNTDLTAIQTAINTLQTNVASIQNTQQTQSTSISNLNTQMETLTTQVTALSEKGNVEPKE